MSLIPPLPPLVPPISFGDPSSYVLAGTDDLLDDREESLASRAVSSLRTALDIPIEALQKSAFWRSFQAKQQQDAYIVVDAYVDRPLDDGRIVTEIATENWREYRFVISNVSMPKSEKVSVLRTFGEDSDFLMTFGRDSMVWQFQGVLRNESGTRGDWVSALERRYQLQLRASVLARQRKVMRLVIGELDVTGYMMSLDVQRSGNMDDTVAAFSFNMLVRDYGKVTRDPDELAILEPSALDQTVPEEWSAFAPVDLANPDDPAGLGADEGGAVGDVPVDPPGGPPGGGPTGGGPTGGGLA